MLSSIRCYFILVFTLGSDLVQAQSIKFDPVSSRTASVLPKSEGLPDEGHYTSSTEVFEVVGKYYMVVNDLAGGWPCEKINVALLQSDDFENWSWFEKPLFSSGDLSFQLGKPNGFVLLTDF